MIDILQNQIKDFPSREEKINHLREFLQILNLKIIYDLGYFKNLSFVGGTALRILFDLRRFSEDLDFSLTSRKNYDFEVFIQKMHSQLSNYGLAVELKKQAKKTVANLDVKFTDILFDLGLSPLKEEKLFIKVEIDTNPPNGAEIDISLVNKTYIFTVAHYDIPSLFATKIHACFYRKYIKGRDFYDLIWYLGKKVKPNFELLNNAIVQTHGQREPVNEGNYKQFLKEQLARIDFSQARRDVERFLEDKKELDLLNRDLILRLIDSA